MSVTKRNKLVVGSEIILDLFRLSQNSMNNIFIRRPASFRRCRNLWEEVIGVVLFQPLSLHSRFEFCREPVPKTKYNFYVFDSLKVAYYEVESVAQTPNRMEVGHLTPVLPLNQPPQLSHHPVRLADHITSAIGRN